jgi:hypothetical protein
MGRSTSGTEVARVRCSGGLPPCTVVNLRANPVRREWQVTNEVLHVCDELLRRLRTETVDVRE